MTIGLYRTAGWEMHGRFQYSKIVMEALIANRSALPDELVYLSTPADALRALARLDLLEIGGIPIRAVEEKQYVQRPLEHYLAAPPDPNPKIDLEIPPPNAAYRARIEQLGVNWLFLLETTLWGLEARTPFIMPIHDLQHRQQPHFAEFSHAGGFLYREKLYRNTCRQATLILVDSEIGKEDVIRGYGDVIEPDRIKVLPFGSAFRSAASATGRMSLATARQHYKLPEKYIFYPGQFQPHKNQSAVLCALDLIRREHGAEVHFVFCGAYNSYNTAVTFTALMQMIAALGLQQQCHYLGYVSDDDMPALYEGATALVMSTYVGPTNLPIIEAWDLGCPVLTSRTRGLTELIGDSGLLAAPDDPKELADTIYRLWTDDALCAELARRGQARLATHGGNDFVPRLLDIVQEADDRIKRGDRRD
jgi:glycosyltransferase involved in cell wall biosynthesis